MIELILLVGLLFVLGLVVVLHICSTIDNPEVTQVTGQEPLPELHPWFVTVEAILALAIIYIGQHL